MGFLADIKRCMTPARIRLSNGDDRETSPRSWATLSSTLAAYASNGQPTVQRQIDGATREMLDARW